MYGKDLYGISNGATTQLAWYQCIIEDTPLWSAVIHLPLPAKLRRCTSLAT
jgi:hypothetical protein